MTRLRYATWLTAAKAETPTPVTEVKILFAAEFIAVRKAISDLSHPRRAERMFSFPAEAHGERSTVIL